MKKITGELQSGHAKRECLLRQDNFVSKSVSVRRDGRELDWEASTLPLSYTRLSNLSVILCNKSWKIKLKTA